MERVLVPHDLSDFSDRGLIALRDLPIATHGVHVVHVLPRIDLSYPGMVWSKDEDEPRRRHAIEALQHRLDTAGLAEATAHVCLGDPGTRVVVLAREIGASLIVMPSHGRGGLKRMLLGSVAEHVARFAPCPVMILPAGSLPVHPTPPPAPERPEMEREEQVDRLGSEISDRVAKEPGMLTSLRVRLPADHDPLWWSKALHKRLAAAGIEFVDIDFAPGTLDRAEIANCCFEEGWAD